MCIRALSCCIILGHSDALMGVIYTSNTEFGEKMKFYNWVSLLYVAMIATTFAKTMSLYALILL